MYPFPPYLSFHHIFKSALQLFHLRKGLSQACNVEQTVTRGITLHYKLQAPPLWVLVGLQLIICSSTLIWHMDVCFVMMWYVYTALFTLTFFLIMVECSNFNGEWMFDIHAMFCSIMVDDSWGTCNTLTVDIKCTSSVPSWYQVYIKCTPHGVCFFKCQLSARDDGH